MVRTTGNPYYYEDDCDFFALCTTYTTLGGGSGGDGGTGTGPGPGGNPGSGGTGGSGGSGGEWGGGNPCGGNAARTNREAPGGDCDPGWEPVDNGDNNYPDVNSIIDSLLSPCLKNTLHSMLLNNYTSQISSMLNTIWGATTDCNIRFLQTDTLPWGVDGITNTTISFGIMTQRVRLNQPVLDSASIEYVTTTMFHEVLHAYLNATGQYGNLKNHNTMANQYVNMLSSSLTEHFPSLDPVDVKALAWGGLHDTQAWDSIKVNHPVEYNDLRTRNARHRVHTAGTICNK